MRKMLALALSALILGSMAVVPLAQAESSKTETDFNAVVAVSLANPGQFFADAAGNRYYQGLVYTGQLTGWPVTGTLRIDANVAFEGGSTTGQIDGSYVISDSMGSSFHGDLKETRVQESANGLLISARLDVDGGTGLFDDARGHAQIAGNLPTLGVNAAAFGPAFGQPGFGAFTANPWQINPNQPTLALSGTIRLDDTPDLASWWNQGQDNPFNFQFENRDAQHQFREAIHDFFNVANNHEHVGTQNNHDGHQNQGNNRSHGRGHKKD
jgi:hypothetical protein